MNMLQTVNALRDAGEDFEWYPTTRRMVEVVSRNMGTDNTTSIMDVGAGDGRVLAMLAERHTRATLYAIEKAAILRQQQPTSVIPVGTEFFEQDLMSLPVDVIFCNPPYSEFEAWAARIIETAHARTIYLVIPQRWEGSAVIKAAIKARSATAKIIHTDDFLGADRRARAVVHIVRVTLKSRDRSHWDSRPEDPFDRWFDQNIDTFDRQEDIPDYKVEEQTLARLHRLDSIASLVAAFNEEYARMEENYKAIFRLDYAILKELGVNKNDVRDGLKKRMAGLKNTYWQTLFNHLDAVTSRLSTKTKRALLERLTGQTAVAFTESNAYAIVLWAIRNANQYFDTQLVDLFRALSTHEGVLNYASNQRTWAKDGWRYNSKNEEQFSHYALDYRIVLHHYKAIVRPGDFNSWESPGHLDKSCHELIDDVVAVMGNLGFRTPTGQSRRRVWHSNCWQDFYLSDDRLLFQVKAFLNGNLHFRFMPAAIQALNIEAGRLLGWLRGPADVVAEMGGSMEDAERFFGANAQLGASAVRLLAARGER